MPAPTALTLAELADQIDRYRQTHAGASQARVVLAYDPGHTTVGGRPKMSIVGISPGFDWDHGSLFLQTAQPVGVVPEVLRQKLHRYENLVGHLLMHLRRADDKGTAPDAEVIRSLIQRLQDGAFDSQQPHWDTEAVRTEPRMAHDLGIQVAAVRKRLKAGQLIAFTDPVTGEHFFPAYQAWAAVGNRPLPRILAALNLSTDTATRAHAWLTHPQEVLEECSPLEVLVGEGFATGRPAHPGLLDRPHRERVEAVVAAARTFQES